ncbi:MAG: TonB-dependent receptor [Mariniphaga sp.]|nr:TonB-dependent receptor [Mariniphaga sp.]
MEKSQIKGIFTLLFLTILMVFSLGSYAQDKQLLGSVADTDGAPVPGVTVVVSGTTIGTVTDFDGNFTLAVPADAATLMFSYIGMRTQGLEIGDQTTFNVVMEPDVIGVDEVVVIGYGTRLKEELTGAVSTVSEEKMQISTAPSIMSRIQGQVSGVTVTSSNVPGGDATIRIRGVGTINDPNPLYVIDGVPSGPGNNLSASDIESISILKDASSAAIYGTRGANGVIIITTKKGRANQQPSISFTARTGISQATNKYDMLNTQEYAEAVWLSFANRGAAPSHAQYGSGSNPVIPDYILPGGAMEGDPAVNPALYNYPDYTIYKANKQGTDWHDESYQTGIIQEYGLQVSGGGKNSTYSFSGNYLDEEGILKYSDFKRYTFRMNSQATFNDWFKAGESLQVVYINQHGERGDNGEGTVPSRVYRAQPICPVYDINGNFAGSKMPEGGNFDNPVATLTRAKDGGGEWFRILGSVFGEITIMDGLTVKSLLGYNFGQWNGKSYVLPTYEHSEPNRVNGVNVSSNYSLQWNWTNTVNYNATFADIHKVNVVLGTEALENKYSYVNASRRVYFSESTDYMQLNSGESNKENSGSGSEWSLFSVFGRINYDLMGKYFFEATARRDGSSRFSEANRYGTFPAASAAWAISEESFMAGTQNWLDLLKLRVGWGLAGNDRIGNYNSYSTYGTHTYKASYAIDGSNTSAAAGFRPSTLGNEDVTWETTETLNVGLAATMLDKHLAVSVDVWQRNTSDMLYREQIPQVSGTASAPDINIGDMKNTGFDIEAGYNNSAMDGKLTYAANLTLSHYKNEILRISSDDELEIDAGSERQMTYTRFSKGTAFPEFYGYNVEGIFQTDAEAAAHPQYGTSDYNKAGHFKFTDTNGDGVIDADDRDFIGSPHPDLVGGLNIDLGYGNFDLNLFFYSSIGNEMVNYVTRWIDYGMFNGGLSHDALYDSWGSPYVSNNADAKLPMLDQNDISQQPSTAFIEDASYLKLKSLRLGYTVPKNILDRAQIKSLRVYAQVTNLFTITGYSGLDPEYRTSGSGMGLDRGAWPTPRQVMFGVTLGL